MVVNESMYQLGSVRSAIRELFEYGKKRAAIVGKENVYDFSIGNPSIPAPQIVNDTIKELVTDYDSVALHGYTSAQGDVETRAAIAEFLNNTHGTHFNADNLYMTMGAAASLSICFRALTSDAYDEFITIAPYFPEYKVFVNAAVARLVEFMLTIDVKISCIVVLITPLSLFVASFITKKTYSMFQLQTRTRGEQTSLIDEIVGNEKVVQAFNHEDEALEQFDEINDRLQKCSLRATFFSSLTNPSTRFVNSLLYAGVGIFGAMSALTGGITVGQLSCFLSYANQYTKPFNEISGVITELQNALACAARIFELIEEKKEIPDASDAVTLEEADGRVDIEDVYFSYAG